VTQAVEAVDEAGKEFYNIRNVIVTTDENFYQRGGKNHAIFQNGRGTCSA
jgi:hypothetical protein